MLMLSSCYIQVLLLLISLSYLFCNNYPDAPRAPGRRPRGLLNFLKVG